MFALERPYTMFNYTVSSLTSYLYISLNVVFVLGFIFIIHEGGHYIVCRLFNAPPRSFSIGMGPILFKWTDSLNTEWRLSLLPFGAYVEPDTSKHMNRIQMILIALAGPVANFIGAFVLFVGVFALNPVSITTESPEKAYVTLHHIKIAVSPHELDLPLFGSQNQIQHYRFTLQGSLMLFNKFFYHQFYKIIDLLKGLFTKTQESVGKLKGPVGIVKIISQTDSVPQLLLLTTKLSLSLCIFNLVPCPPLDGWIILTSIIGVFESNSLTLLIMTYNGIGIILLLTGIIFFQDIISYFQ